MDRHGDGSVGLSCKQVVETSKVEVGSQVCGEPKKFDLKIQKRIRVGMCQHLFLFSLEIGVLILKITTII